jgi:hypothetical protein
VAPLRLHWPRAGVERRLNTTTEIKTMRTKRTRLDMTHLFFVPGRTGDEHSGKNSGDSRLTCLGRRYRRVGTLQIELAEEERQFSYHFSGAMNL